MGKRGYLPEFPLALGCRFPALQREIVDPHARRVDRAAEDTRARWQRAMRQLPGDTAGARRLPVGLDQS